MKHTLPAHERVSLALHHQEADRVPYAIGGGPYGIVDDLDLRLLQHFKRRRFTDSRRGCRPDQSHATQSRHDDTTPRLTRRCVTHRAD